MIEFIDHTGHTYSLPSYPSYPVGYEYQETPYIHDFSSVCGVKLSCENYYIMPVRMVLLNEMPQENIEISVDSDIFHLISARTIQDKISEAGDLIFEIDESLFSDHLTKDDLIALQDNDATVYIFYVIAYAEGESCAWSSNILIKISGAEEYEQYVPLTVRADFYNIREELEINGKNLGITLPHDIIKAVWQGSFYNDVLDEALYNEKLKEYLMNYMRLKVEKGNVQQAVSALKWFGWGDRLKIVKLLRNDNKVIAQYIRDYLSITSDNLKRHSHFIGTGLLSVFMEITEEKDDVADQKWENELNKEFIGEGKPLIESLIDKMEAVTYDEEDIEFYRPVLEYSFVELGVKLSCLRSFYDQEFLPVHSMLHSAALQHQAWMNDVKFHIRPFVKKIETPMLIAQKKGTMTVRFPSVSTQYIYIQQAYVDEDMNEMSWYADHGDEIDATILYIDDVMVRIPIRISSTETDTFNCVLLVEKEGVKIWESHFSFCQQDGTRDWNNFVMFPRLMNSRRTMHYWVDKNYRISLLVNGLWFEYNFILKVPEFVMTLGRLNYRYDETLHRQVRKITDDMVDFESFMYLPSLVDVRHINFCRDLVKFENDGLLHKFIDMYHEKPSIPFSTTSNLAGRYWNQIHMFRIFENNVELMYDRDEDIVPLYRKLFNDDGTQKQTISQDGLDYDIYLMHDSTGFEDYKDILTIEQFTALTPRWYVVLISRQTIDAAKTPGEIRVPEVKIEGWKLEHTGSDKKWLINRMTFEDKTDNPIFKGDDIIAGSLHGIKMPFILTDGTKWEIRPFSLGMDKDAQVSSNTNAFIMSLGGDNYSNERGYYNIVARYSLDGSLQYQKELRLRILVK